MELIIVFFTTLLFSILNIIQVVRGAFTVPKNSVYIGIPHWYEDYFYYLSHLTQGASGLWQTQNWYTTDTIPPNFGWWTNIVLGKIGNLLSLDPWVSYRSMIFILCFLLILTMYAVSKKLFPDRQLLRLSAFLLSLMGTAFFAFGPVLKGMTIIPYTFFFSTTLSLNRLGGTVHQLTANIISLILILTITSALTKACEKKHIYQLLPLYILLSILAFLLTMLQPIAGLMILGVTGLGICILSVKKINWNLITRYFLIFFALFIPIILVCFKFYLLSKHPFYTYTLKTYEGSIPPASPFTLLLSLGGIAVCIPFGILPWMKKKSVLHLLGGIYGILPFFLYLSPIPQIVGIQYSRILQPGSHVFLAAIAIMGLWNIAQWIHKKIHTRSPVLIFTLLCTLLLLLHTPVIMWEVRERLKAGDEFKNFNTIPTSLYDALTFLKTQPFGNCIAPYWESLYIPIIAGKTVYMGHRTMTVNYEKKMTEASAFLSMNISTQDAALFLSKNRIRYVVVPYDAKWQKTFQEMYPFLFPLKTSASHVVYDVRL